MPNFEKEFLSALQSNLCYPDLGPNNSDRISAKIGTREKDRIKG